MKATANRYNKRHTVEQMVASVSQCMAKGQGSGINRSTKSGDTCARKKTLTLSVTSPFVTQSPHAILESVDTQEKRIEKEKQQ